jgi:hypothetical protein
MRPNLSPIKLRLPAWRHPAQAAWLRSLAAISFGVIYLTGSNRNLLYLGMLFSAYIILSLIWSRGWAALLALGASAYLAGVPAKVPQVKFIDPSPAGVAGLCRLPQEETWTYRFRLTDLARYRATGPLDGNLNIDGHGLSGLEISVNGKDLPGRILPAKKYTLEHAVIPLSGENQVELDISLRARPGTMPAISEGPEARHSNIYSDAVWLEFANQGEAIIYHAGRSVAGLPSAR